MRNPPNLLYTKSMGFNVMNQPGDPIRILIIDKTAGLKASHERHQSLAALPDIDLHVLGPVHWIENGRSIGWDPPADTRYRVHFGRVFGKDYYARVAYYSGLNRAIRNAKPDLIQLLEEPWSVSAWQTLVASRIQSPSAKLLFYTWENIERGWDYPSRARWLYRIIDRAMHKHACGAVCATQQACHVLQKKGFSKPVAVIPYGILDMFFQSGPSSVVQPIPFTVGYIGRLLHMKGVDLLLEAVRDLPDTRLLIAGGGEDGAGFRDIARQEGLESRVEWTGAVAEHEIPALMEKMSVLVLPSRTTPGWSEQLGRVLIEAMAVGVPVIGSTSGAIPEVIGDAGLLFQEERVDELRKYIRLLQQNEEFRKSMIQKGKHRASSLYTWKRFAEDLRLFYREIIQNSFVA